MRKETGSRDKKEGSCACCGRSHPPVFSSQPTAARGRSFTAADSAAGADNAAVTAAKDEKTAAAGRTGERPWPKKAAGTCEHGPLSCGEAPVSSGQRLKQALAAAGLTAFFGTAMLLYERFHIVICPLYNFFGIPCPTCGMTRSWLSLLRGKIKDAFRYHPLFFLAPLLLAAIFLYEKYRNRGKKWLSILLIAVLSLFVLTWIIRLILFFPHTEPMVWNHDAVLPSVWRFIQQFRPR